MIDVPLIPVPLPIYWLGSFCVGWCFASITNYVMVWLMGDDE